MKVKEVKAKTKKLDESNLSFSVKEMHSLAELILTRQEEKQALIDEFNSESRRFLIGKLSKKTVDSSVRKTKTEIERLDADIKDSIKDAKKFLKKIEKQLSNQVPKKFKIDSSGIEEIQRKGGKKR
jgi:Trp operon repressor